MTSKEIMQCAIAHYGAKSQIDMAIEEMSELTKALLKHRRAEAVTPLKVEHLTAVSNARSNMIEEIADVEIMIEQLKIMFHCEEKVQEWKDKKIARLQKRLEGQE